ncbi:MULTISPECIES: serine hydrolase [Microbacterium]|uniref:serine hydrolase n=1 Tax=Microbacterium TaxID=33882 RepID=UPI0018E06661|nr:MULTISPECIES: serine hydrolase [Microbacterium]
MSGNKLRVVSAVGGAVLVLSGLTACTFADASTEPTPSATATMNPDPGADALATVTRAQVDAAVDDLEASVESAMEASGTPGIAVGVVYEGEVLYAEGFGVRDLDSGEPVDADTVFALASVSKSIGASVVARAIDEGYVSWDTPVAEHLDGFTLSDPYVGSHVTIADMYAHRSGLFKHAGDELEEIGYDRATILERLSLIPLAPWRSTYAYGNFDITAAGESVARAAGEEWPDLSERLLYEPLGMTSTSSRYEDLESRENRALGHLPLNGEWVVTPDQRQPDEQSPAGGVSSNITDLMTWLSMLLAGGEHDGEAFVEASSLVPAMSPQIVGSPPSSFGSRAGYYGYGFNVGTTPGGLVDVNHSGAFLLGTGTVFKLLPGAGLGIVVLSNASANGVPEGIAARFLDIAQYGHERRDWLPLFMGVFEGESEPFGELVGETAPSDAAAAQDLEAYTGEYANEYFGAATVQLVGDELELALGPTGRWALEHWSGDEFVFRPFSENAPPGSVSKATFDGDNLVLEYFDQHGLGTFTR